MEHGIRTTAAEELDRIMRRAFKHGNRGIAKACLRELNRRAKLGQVTVLSPDGARLCGPEQEAA